MATLTTVPVRPANNARRALATGALTFALLAGAFGAAAQSASAVDTFAATGSMAQGRYWPAWSVLPDGKVLVAGGSGNSPGSPSLSSAEIYDPAAGTWSATAPMSTTRRRAGFVTLPDGKVLVAGGETGFGTGVMSSAELYDPATGTWSATAPMSTPRVDFGMVLLANGKVLAGGGSSGGGGSGLSSAELYDPATGTWSATGSLTAIAPNTSFVRLTDGKVLAPVGSNPGSDTTANIYNPATGTWAATGSYGTAHTDGVLVALPGGKALIAGGFVGVGVTAVAEVYDSAAGTWSATGSMATARLVPGATLMANGKVLVAGGDSGSGGGGGPSILSSAEVYDPATGTFSTVGSMSVTRAAVVAIPLPSGSVLVPGGFSDSISPAGVTATADIFSPTLPVGTLSPESADFGSRQINTGASAAKTFTLASSGDAPVVIGSAGPSVTGTDSGQFAVSGGTCTANASVAVGSSCTVTVTFNPTASGAKTATLSVPTNVGEKTAALTGTGVAGGTVKVSSATYSSTRIRTRVRVSGAGKITQRGTRNTGGASAAKTVTACRASTVSSSKAGTYTVTCKLNSATRKARTNGAVRVRLRTTFTPTGGTATTTTRTITLRSLKPSYTG